MLNSESSLRFVRTSRGLLVGSVMCWALTTSALAQFAPGGPGGPGFPGGGNQFPAGIEINADGVVSLKSVRTGLSVAQRKKLERLAADSLPADLVMATERRVISLRQLFAAVRETRNSAAVPPASLMFLSGLQRIDAVALDPAQRDIYLIGPAEGFAADETGRMIGQSTGRPPLRWDDLLVAFQAANSGTRSIGVSIDPTPANMAKLQEFLARNSTPATTASVKRRYQAMAQLLGPQQISLWGVPDDSHFAAALVEADYRMKRIALGLEPAGVRGIVSHLSLLTPQGNSLQRWWFTPRYNPLQVNQDFTYFELSGPRAQLLAQEEYSDAQGQKFDAALTRQSTQLFARRFSDHFEGLANISPTFAQLQGLFDAFVAATLIVDHSERLGLSDELQKWLTDSRVPVGDSRAPRTVPSSATSRMAGGGLMIGLVGGVTLDVGDVARTTEPLLPGVEPPRVTPFAADRWYETLPN